MIDYEKMGHDLQKLIQVNFFAKTVNAMTKWVCETKDNKIFDRIRKGEIPKPATIERYCNEICKSYSLSEYTLSHLWEYWELSESMSQTLSSESLIELVKCNFESVKDENTKLSLQEFAKESFLDYCYVLALFYGKCYINSCNRKDIYDFDKEDRLYDAIGNSLVNLLKKDYPEIVGIYQAIRKLFELQSLLVNTSGALTFVRTCLNC